MDRREALLRAREGGFSLVELMVVVLIIGLLSTIVAVNAMRSRTTAAITTARANMHAIDQAIQLYRMEQGRAPDSLDELVAQPGPEGHESYLDAGRAALRDPWKRPYVYEPGGSRGGRRSYTLGSYGADGVAGGENENADIFPLEEEGA